MKVHSNGGYEWKKHKKPYFYAKKADKKVAFFIIVCYNSKECSIGVLCPSAYE